MKKIFLIVAICLNLVAQSIINGDVEIVQIGSNFAGNLSIDGKKRSWHPHPEDKNLKFAIVSASYHKKGELVLKNELNGEITSVIFKVEQGDYKKEKISVEPSKVTPPKDVLERIEKERKEASKIYATYSKGLKFNSEFISPMSSVITSEFGTARVFNDLVKSYHSGTDFRAAIGTPVVSSNDGIVVIAKDRYYAGGSVVIDHGEGIYTQYYHLSRIDVKLGAKIKKGEIIGLSGASGRVSGPHLHFGVIVNSVQVNPINFIKKINALF
ncbi:M23 family metallopeptidase [Campylobacter sp. CCUG 57310]|uniref:M23 family metallopeptidase n=1 Tax=Campylobacter sp. CCUG 57310 TaxID=2517362 RepID=UPI0015647A19|nr:M23 family metallopeptidase [Campylobacter sp. CCUG 57310]QKF92359.1 zinc metallopeptidase, M23 family [Campylobacter sp. CCUG 57310]